MVSMTALQSASMQTASGADPTTVEPSSATPRTIGTKTFRGLGVTLELEQHHATGDVILRLTGPSDVWFGIGFNTLTMGARPYAIIVDGSTGTYHERRLGTYSAGDLLGSSLQELSGPSHINGKCRVELRRAWAGMSPRHFTFSPAASSLNLIAAVGGHAVFGYHAATEVGGMSLV